MVFAGVDNARAWALDQVSTLPKRWESRLIARWDSKRGQGLDCIAQTYAERDANIELRHTVEGFKVISIPLDASDSTICKAAEQLAERASEMARVYHQIDQLREAMARIAAAHGATPPDTKKFQNGPAVARMADPQWWRRQLRAVHAKHVEGAAIRLGYVNKKADPYVSRESLLRRAQQNERNAASLEATIATNEAGQEYTLAELAAKGPANKAIRRAELMTRIAGFERIADDMGHVGIFLTMTAPSRMHKFSTVGGRVFENKKYDGTTPGQAQHYHAKTWALIRAKLKRQGIGIYGFRIAEPNHDGTPHWHCLFFLDGANVAAFRAIVMHYCLRDSGTERGAIDHRVDWKPIDKGRGSAAGYIAKYVAKNIDGYRLDKDLIGNDAIETSHRVEAWASTWRIRQFQQIGGPPVGPWRELRRVKAMPANAPQHLQDAHRAANRQELPEGTSDKQAQWEAGAKWDKYVQAQGGVFCGRRYAIRIEKMQREGLNKYGEALAAVPIGVSTLETYTPAHMAWMNGKATRRLIVDSERHVWTITRKAAGSLGVQKPAFGGPWTCVNNCTGASNERGGNEQGSDKETDRGGNGGMGEGTRARASDSGGLRGAGYCGTGSYQYGTGTD